MVKGGELDVAVVADKKLFDDGRTVGRMMATGAALIMVDRGRRRDILLCTSETPDKWWINI